MSASGIQQLTAVVGQFYDIARFRRGPEDLPVSRSLLMSTLVAYLVVSLIFSFALPPQEGHPALLLAIDTALMLLWIWLVVRLAHHPERFLQTTTAVFGFQLVLAPLFTLGMALFLKLRGDPSWELPASLLIVALGIWALVVNARILQSATQWPVFACAALVLAQALAARGVLLALFPEAASAP